MKDVLSGIAVLFLAAILSIIESAYNLLKNEKLWLAIGICAILYFVGSSLLAKIEEILRNIMDKLDSISEALAEIRDYEIRGKVNFDEYSEDAFYINTYNLSEDKRITEEGFVELKNEIFDLLEMPGQYKDMPVLPIEKAVAKRAFRFILLMDKYNYLTVDDAPGVDGTPEGGVMLRFWYFVVGFIIEIPPEENQPIHYYRETMEGERYGDGYSNNPLEVLHALIESGTLWQLKEAAQKEEEDGAEPPPES
ncbi:MAG: hypothetical protein Q7O12_12915 [Deltaproteobacteria bacterium]|nr:hypothetical protein [Deltaproteobacteria bacterium]